MDRAKELEAILIYGALLDAKESAAIIEKQIDELNEKRPLIIAEMKEPLTREDLESMFNRL